MMTQYPTAPAAFFAELTDVNAFFHLAYFHVPADGDWSHYYEASYGNGGDNSRAEVSALHAYFVERATAAIQVQAAKRFPAGAAGAEANRQELFNVVMSSLLNRSLAERRMAACMADVVNKKTGTTSRASIASIAGKLAGQELAWEKVVEGTRPKAERTKMNSSEGSAADRATRRIENARAAVEAAETDGERMEAEAVLERHIREGMTIARIAYGSGSADYETASYSPIDDLEAQLDATYFADDSDDTGSVADWFELVTSGVVTESQREALYAVARLDDVAHEEKREAELAAFDALQFPTEASFALAQELEARVLSLRSQAETASVLGKSQQAVGAAISRAQTNIFEREHTVRTLRRGVDGTRRVTVGEVGRAVARQLEADGLGLNSLDIDYCWRALVSYGYDAPSDALCASLLDATAAAMDKNASAPTVEKELVNA